jgi:hypothetical protein
LLLALTAVIAPVGAAEPAAIVFEWERGLGLRIAAQPSTEMYFWIYEWNMFEAMQPGQHTHGSYEWSKAVSSDATEGIVDSPAMTLRMRAVPDGAELTLRVTNTTAAAWPAVAGIIPCWNPGMIPGSNPSMPVSKNQNFADPWRKRSYFVSADGLSPLASRALHFHSAYRGAAEHLSEGGRFLFSNKWPSSEVDAVAGVLVRESEDGKWVTAVAWEDVLAVQGHNPWNCLHVCVRLGALKPGESRTVRGRLYLFEGNRDECLARYRRDFPTAR